MSLLVLLQMVRFHCPIVSVIKSSKPKQTSYKRRVRLYENGYYQEFRQQLETCDWSFIADSDLDLIATKLSDTIIEEASNTIPNKIATIRPNDIS